MLTRADMHPEQVATANDVLRLRRIGMLNDCGFGKTITILTAIAKVLERTDRPVLIVGNPKGVKGTWTNEYKKWEHVQHLDVCVLASDVKKRALQLQCNHRVYVCTHGQVKGLATKPGCPDFVMVVVDEGSLLKGASSKIRSYLEKVSVNAEFRVVMTATPKTRQEDDYWGICKWLDGGEALGKKITEFRDKYMKSFDLPGGRGKLYSMKNQAAADQVRAAIKHLFVEYELPEESEAPFTVYPIHYKLKPESQAVYDQMAEQGIVAGIEVKGGEPLTSMEIKGYLNQLSSGFVYEQTMERITAADLEDAKNLVSLIKEVKNRTPAPLFSDRMDAMRELYAKVVKKHGYVPVLVCYQYKHELTQLREIFPECIDDTSDSFESDFNTGFYAVGLLQYQRSSKAVNLQSQCHVMIQYSQTFNYEDNYQIPRRIARQGQPEDMVYVYKLHFDGTIDDLKTEKYIKRDLTHKQFRELIMRKA